MGLYISPERVQFTMFCSRELLVSQLTTKSWHGASNERERIQRLNDGWWVSDTGKPVRLRQMASLARSASDERPGRIPWTPIMGITSVIILVLTAVLVVSDTC